MTRFTAASIMLFTLLQFVPSTRADEANFERQLDVIYHKQDGFALTMDVVSPREDNNDAAVIVVLSGGWFSNHNFLQPHDPALLPEFSRPQSQGLIDRGYTLFYVVHGTQPKFTIREIHQQIGAAVRYIRYHAEDFNIDPNQIGIMGGSAGGHLSLMQGTRGETGDENANSSEAVSSKVQAVVAYFPPTDFINYGGEGVFFDNVVRDVLPGGRDPFLPALAFVEFDAAEFKWVTVADEDRLAKHYREVAPYYHVTDDDAPTLLLHGDADRLVPLQQSRIIVTQFEKLGVPVELFVKEGGDHGWSTTDEEVDMIGDWFDTHLLGEDD